MKIQTFGMEQMSIMENPQLRKFHGTTLLQSTQEYLATIMLEPAQSKLKVQLEMKQLE
jgi:hypothetical protein